MQTFLPYADFQKSAQCLDYKRLGKQRVEAMQLLRTVCGLSDAWGSHPACLMWQGYGASLKKYGLIMCIEWTNRGFRDTCYDQIEAIPILSGNDENPWWLGNERVHASHRSNLIRKLASHYTQFGWKEPPDFPYYWPI